MKFVATLLIGGLCPAALLAQAPARDAPAPSGTSVIRGRVMAAGADRPLSRVDVRAACPPLKVNKAVLTGADGRYEIADLPAGRYTVSFSRTNYVRANFGQRRPLGQGTPIDVANGQVVARVDAALQLAGVVTGRILDEFGDPVTNARVTPMRFQFINGERRINQAGGGGTTDDLGEYRMYGLLPGQYFVSATAQANQGGDSASASDRTGYAPTYYPGTGNIAEAQRVAVASGQTITGINLTLLPVVAVRVSGAALDSQGRPMAGAMVNLTRRAGTSLIFTGSSYSVVKPDGSFAIGGVTPGDYNLRVSRPGGSDETAAADITVTTADVVDVQLIPVKPSTLRGRVVFEAGDLKPPAMSLLRVSVSHPDSVSGLSGNDTPKDDGAFEIKASAGRALMRAGVFNAGDWRLRRVLAADGADVTDAGFDIPANTTMEGFVVELTSRYAELSGTVVDASGAAVRDCIVVVFAPEPQRWGAMTRYVGVSRPDQDNLYHVRLPPGDYIAASFEFDDSSVSVTDPDVLQQLRDRGTKITLTEGERKALALTLSEPPVF